MSTISMIKKYLPHMKANQQQQQGNIQSIIKGGYGRQLNHGEIATLQKIVINPNGLNIDLVNEIKSLINSINKGNKAIVTQKLLSLLIGICSDCNGTWQQKNCNNCN